uniref:NAC domain-containing protein 74-like isoform X1 n=1 Tax=Albuca bracteata TaxID=82047 RepID=A0A0A7LYT8_ALBBR|nr:NAC domain-containing protein 74-like isoform X1 [Albuca bracteata]
MSKTSLPPGFRFHPTDVELVWYYLKRKIMGKPFRFEAISEVEMYKFAPWDLPEKSCLRSRDLEWYFFCPRDRKYSQGSRTNRATDIGYWKTTGRDRSIVHNSQTVGMKKTLIFHLGKSPQGSRTDWVMYEFRLESKDLVNAGYAQDAYVLCKIFQKSGLGPKNGEQYGAPFNEDDWEDEDTEDAGPLPIFSSTENAHLFSPVPLQFVAPEASELPSMLNVREPSFVQSDFEVGEPSSVQEFSVAEDLSSMQDFCGLEEPFYFQEPFADGMTFEQLEAFLNSSPSHPDTVNGKMLSSAMGVDAFSPVPDLEADHMYPNLVDLSVQPVPEPPGGAVSYDNVGLDLRFHPAAFHEFANENYMELRDIGIAGKEDPIEFVAPGDHHHQPTNTDGFRNIYPEDVVDAYLASEPQQTGFVDHGFLSNLKNKHFA